VEHSYPLDRETQSASSRRASTVPIPAWSDQDWSGPTQPPTLADQMEHLLGEHSEPDPLFFVETWTSGIEAATLSFQSRHHTADPNGTATRTREDGPSHDPFSFSVAFAVPLTFIDNVSSDSSHFPSGFSAAWKDAYGSNRPSSSAHAAQHHDLPCSSPAPNLPINADDAFRMLGVPAGSTRKQIKTAYRQLVWRYHPDRLVHSSDQDRRVATDRMTALNQAYHLLCESAPTTA